MLCAQVLKMCKKIGYEYYYKELFVVKSETRYSCTSVIYFNLESDVIKANCEFLYYYKEHKPNEEVLNMMKTSLKLMKIIKKRKCEYFGHFIRRPNIIQRLLLEARIDGKRGSGRPRTMWMDNIKDWLNVSYKECIRKLRTERSGDP